MFWRADRLAGVVSDRDLDQLLVTHLVNVGYLTGFGGTNGACICGPDTRIFLTDFRYTERAAAEVTGWDVVTVDGDWLGGIAGHLKGRVGFEDDHLSVRTLAKLRDQTPSGVELVACGGKVEELRRVKDEEELDRIARAAELADAVYEWTIDRGLAGRSEIEVARGAVAHMRAQGAEPSFPPIVAAGANGALPHADPGERQIGSGELVVFDMGVELEGYCSDCTRTYATGDPGAEARAIYELVRTAQAAALDSIAAGNRGQDIDAVAREIIAAAGHGKEFGHGLGHGVGIEVHEAPRLSTRSPDTLMAGEVVTVEPGVYVAGTCGVRIEDLVVVTESGHSNLSGLSKELQVVD